MLANLAASVPPVLASGSFAWEGLSVALRRAVDAYVGHIVNDVLPRVDLTDLSESERAAHGLDVAGGVNVNEYLEADYDMALATVGLSSCSALVILDPRLQSHYLAHVMPGTAVPDILRTIHSFFPNPHEELEVYVLPGESGNDRYVAEMSLANIFSALVFINLAERTRIVRYTGTQESPNLLSYRGRLYNYKKPVRILSEQARIITIGRF